MEADALANDPEEEEAELAAIYRDRGLDENLAREVARQLMKKDPSVRTRETRSVSPRR